MGLVDNFKDLFKLADAVNNLDLYKKLTELQTRAMELEEENNRLRTENKDLNEKLHLGEKMTFKAPFYFQEGDDIPYCAVCWEDKMHPIHVVFAFENIQNIRWDCPACKYTYMVKKGGTRTPPMSANPSGDPQGWMG